MTITKLKPIPRSRAKTAWGLCADVIRAIKKEPKRVDMSLVCGKHDPQNGGPACGTIGCFAGWVYILHEGRQKAIHRSFTAGAKAILGTHLDYHTVGEDHKYVFNTGWGDGCEKTMTGTPAHARAVIARITRFMRINRKALKARKLADVWS